MYDYEDSTIIKLETPLTSNVIDKQMRSRYLFKRSQFFLYVKIRYNNIVIKSLYQKGAPKN